MNKIYNWSITITLRDNTKQYFLTQSESSDKAINKCLEYLNLKWNDTLCKSTQVYNNITDLKYHLGFNTELAINI